MTELVRITFFLAAATLAACIPAHLPGAGGDGDGDGGVPGVCGDLVVAADEACDDGNTEPGDGCDASCELDIPDGCGDDVVAGNEECDDGGNAADDGCGPSCKIERCGNGVRDPGEACEDNNTVGGDGCSADCRSDESCGNGVLDPDETCDDGDGDDSDACPGSCEPARCGDSFVQAGLESCDDGNDVADDDCTGCILDSCGNGAMDTGEECDLGAGNGTPGTSCFASCIGTDVAMGEPIATPIDPAITFASAPSSIEAGDLNGDGRVDVAIGDPGAAALVLAYGLGDGRMWPPRHQPGTSSTDVALADVDGDGRLDAVAAESSNTIAVYLGTADGFGTRAVFSTAIDIGGLGPQGIAIAELTGDGNLDVVTANNGSDDVTLLAGDGDGAFVAQTRFGTSSGATGDGPIDLAVADVTGDGVLDVVTANTVSDDVSVLPGLGGGNFGPPEVHSTRIGAGGDQPIAIAIADVSNDGIKDVVTANGASDDVTVLAGTSAGGFAAPLRFVTLAGARGDGPRGLAVGDVTGDGKRDIVTVNTSDDVAVLATLGVGVAFAPAVHLALVGEGEEVETKAPEDVAIVDLDRDGKADLVALNRSSNDLTVLQGTGSGAFAGPRSYEVTFDFSGGNVLALAAAELDGDDHRDVVVAGSAGLTAVAGLGDGRLVPTQAHSLQISGHPALGDIDGDGRLDWAAPRGQFVQLGFQLPSGDYRTVFSASAGSPSFSAAALGNVDADDALELSAGDLNNQLIDFDGDVGGGPISPAFLSLPAAPSHLVLADVTGDGELDLIAALPTTDEVRISAGDGLGGFSAPAGTSTAVSTSGQAPQFVAVADVDGDGKPDVCTANAGSNDVTVLLGEGSGSFGDPIIASAVFGGEPAEVRAVRAGDLNGDGRLDLVTANLARGTVSVLIGFGDGGFAAPQSFDVGPSPGALVVADLDGDGIDDIGALLSDEAKIVVLRSEGHP